MSERVFWKSDWEPIIIGAASRYDYSLPLWYSYVVIPQEKAMTHELTPGEKRAKPVRLQLSRKKGFSLQLHSYTKNGLPAVNVARPNKWGNPYKVGTCLIPDEQAAVDALAANLPLKFNCSELRGKNLACWCSLDKPCHADILLALANKES